MSAAGTGRDGSPPVRGPSDGRAVHRCRHRQRPRRPCRQLRRPDRPRAGHAHAALGGNGQGTNPEQLFAAGYAACFASALGLVGRQAKVDTGDISVTAEASIGKDGNGFGTAVTLRVELPESLMRRDGRPAGQAGPRGLPLLQGHPRQHPRRARHRVTAAGSPTVPRPPRRRSQSGAAAGVRRRAGFALAPGAVLRTRRGAPASSG